jgi:colanic acid/amylovoran biosynthesis glycosyltransferase
MELNAGPLRRVDPSRCIAYLTTCYPEVSHTFIRREIEAMEKRGVLVRRLAIRAPRESPIHPADFEERRRTFVCLEQSPACFLVSAMLAVLTRPMLLLQAAWQSLRIGIRSERGVLRHLAYLVEATVLLREVRRCGAAHLHVHFGTNAATVAMLMRMLGGPPFSFTAHGPDEFDAPRSFAISEKVAAATFVVAISSFCRAQLQRWSRHEDRHKIRTIRCGIPSVFFESGRPAPDLPLLLTIGRLSAQKGHATLLEAVRRLVDRGVAVRLVIAGDGELRESLETEASRLGVANSIRFVGAISERQVREQLDGCRALVMASSAEGLPMVLMEAMAMQRVVVATAVSGIPELVRPGRNGWLVPAGDEDALANAMQAVLEAPIESVREMGRAAREDAREKHAIEATVDGILGVLGWGAAAEVRSAFASASAAEGVATEAQATLGWELHEVGPPEVSRQA